MNFKSFLYSIYVRIFLITIIIFIIMDIIFSNTIIENIIRKDCIDYIKYSLNKTNYYTYDLKKNCFAFEAKKQAMRVTIESKWGWDEAFQLALHEQRWGEKPWFIIEDDGQGIGTVSLHQIDDKTLRFGEFYLLDSYRNKGIGTGVLEGVLKDCDAKGLRVVLEYLRWNPVGSLYKRYGFIVTSESDIHYFMERTL